MKGMSLKLDGEAMKSVVEHWLNAAEGPFSHRPVKVTDVTKSYSDEFEFRFEFKIKTAAKPATRTNTD